MTKWKKYQISVKNAIELEPVPIVSDAAIATEGLGNGRIIPVLIIDTANRPDVENMIKAHQHLSEEGDVESYWGKTSRFNVQSVRLVLSFSKISECVAILEFDILKQGGVVDQIIQAEALYIQAGRLGDRVITTPENPRLVVEVPSKDFRVGWEKIWVKCLVKKFRKDGLSRKLAKQTAQNFISEWRESLSFRIN